MNRLLTSICAVAAFALSATPANAGPFSEWIAENVPGGENIQRTMNRMTPIVRNGVIIGYSAAGAAGGQVYGVPAPIGGAAGACYGQNVNSVAAGRGVVDCSRHVLAAGVQHYGQQYIPTGNYCWTDGGRFGPGPSRPVGEPCFATRPWGTFHGRVAQ